MVDYEQGDHIKVEFKDDKTGESEWMWVEVESWDDERRVVFGRLDSEPLMHAEKLQLGQRLAVSYDNIHEHRSRGNETA